MRMRVRNYRTEVASSAESSATNVTAELAASPRPAPRPSFQMKGLNTWVSSLPPIWGNFHAFVLFPFFLAFLSVALPLVFVFFRFCFSGIWHRGWQVTAYLVANQSRRNCVISPSLPPSPASVIHLLLLLLLLFPVPVMDVLFHVRLHGHCLVLNLMSNYHFLELTMVHLGLLVDALLLFNGK